MRESTSNLIIGIILSAFVIVSLTMIGFIQANQYQIVVNRLDHNTQTIVKELKEHRYMTDCLILRPGEHALLECLHEAQTVTTSTDVDDLLAQNLSS